METYHIALCTVLSCCLSVCWLSIIYSFRFVPRFEVSPANIIETAKVSKMNPSWSLSNQYFLRIIIYYAFATKIDKSQRIHYLPGLLRCRTKLAQFRRVGGMLLDISANSGEKLCLVHASMSLTCPHCVSYIQASFLLFYFF